MQWFSNYFDRNNISSLQPDLLKQVKSLKTLNLSHNSLSSIPPDAFIDLINLNSLDLSFNHFSDIDPKTFEFMFRLKELNLSGNKLKEVNPNIFKFIKGIFRFKAIILSIYNDDIICWHLDLIVLDLGSNQLETFDFYSFNILVKLEVLTLSSNPLEQIGSRCETNEQILKKIRKISLDKCSLRTVKANQFRGLTSLEILSINQNEINFIEDNAFKQLPSLKELYLNDNLLKKINETTLRGATNLLVLHVTNNKIRTIAQDAFFNLGSLSELDLSLNKLKSLGKRNFPVLSIILEMKNSTKHWILY